MKHDDLSNIFVTLLSKSQQKLYTFIRAQVRCASDADDILQETSTILWKKFEQFDRTKDFSRWACGIARFEVMSHRRNQKKIEPLFTDDVADAFAEQLLDLNEEVNIRKDALMECLENLSAPQRDIVVMRYNSSLSVKEIATQINRPEKTIYRWLSKVHQLLFECIEQRIPRKIPRKGVE